MLIDFRSTKTILLEPLTQRTTVEAIKKVEGFMDEKLHEIDEKLEKQWIYRVKIDL